MSNSRTNNATRADIYRHRLFASGTFKNVYAGMYTVGERAGQRCVSKEFKTGSVYETHYFDEEMNVMRRAQAVIDDWQDGGFIDKRILLNTPEIWQYEGTGVKTLVEPMIQNYEKFNSNSGWSSADGGASSEAMQALSHFSYHNSGGQFLLCDLQGGAYQDGYILSDPVIMSQTKTYGPADLGPDGIRSFFGRHKCGPFCRRKWQRPKSQAAAGVGVANIPMRQSTTMVYLPTRASRGPLTRQQE
ncbi:kinase-like domain-containing protein [Nemania sp. NC0429]|nr:kinase-like domain-containing protein [Nemania sp. NC0429]